MKIALFILVALAVIALGYFAYIRYILKPKLIALIHKNHPNTDADDEKLMKMSVTKLRQLTDPNVH